MSHNSRLSKSRVGLATSAALITFVSVLAACGGSGSGGNDDNTPTTVRTKNAVLNNCVSVISGERPPAGVTIPRCIPTTIAGTPARPRK